jgi:transcriptional regulator with XRE-family HTH domain
MVDKQALALRAKLLGARMREARMANGKSLRQVAKAIGISSSTLSSCELGNRAISLPDLELFAFNLRVPLQALLAGKAAPSAANSEFDQDMMRSLRNRVIGTSLRVHRKNAGKTIRDLAKHVGLPPSRISAYERGERSIPIPELQVISEALERSVEDYIETEGPVGEWAACQRVYDLAYEMSPELRQFLSQPTNLQYLQLAKRLSELPVERLRSVAEGLQDITP